MTLHAGAGRFIRTLLDDAVGVGLQCVTWNARDAGGRRVASGVYYVRLEAGGASSTRAMVLRE